MIARRTVFRHLEGLKCALVKDETELKRLSCSPLRGAGCLIKNGRSAEMKLEQMPRYPLLCGFTPLQRMENLEQALAAARCTSNGMI